MKAYISYNVRGFKKIFSLEPASEIYDEVEINAKEIILKSGDRAIQAYTGEICRELLTMQNKGSISPYIVVSDNPAGFRKVFLEWKTTPREFV